MKRTIFAVLAALALSATPAMAEKTVIKDSKVQVWFPDDWSMEKENGLLVISDPQEEVALSFLTVPAERVDEAMEALDEQIAKMATNVKLSGEPEETEINGMKVVVVDAKGKAQGKSVEISAALVLRPAKKFLLLFGVVESAKLKKHEKTLTKILGSIKPT